MYPATTHYHARIAVIGVRTAATSSSGMVGGAGPSASSPETGRNGSSGPGSTGSVAVSPASAGLGGCSSQPPGLTMDERHPRTLDQLGRNKGHQPRHTSHGTRYATQGILHTPATAAGTAGGTNGDGSCFGTTVQVAPTTCCSNRCMPTPYTCPQAYGPQS